MEHSFLQDRLREHGLKVIAPESPQEREAIHSVIETELSHNIINEPSKKVFLESINGLVSRGAQAIVLGCTEIPLLIKQTDLESTSFSSILLVDSTSVHVMAAVDVQLLQTSVADYGTQRCL